MQAVITSGGKQYLVKPDQRLEIDLLGEGVKELTFEPLLVIDGDKISVGSPTVTGIVVSAEVIDVVKGRKIKVLKFKPKKRIKKLTGHRQRYTQIKIKSISPVKAAAKVSRPAAKTQKAAA